VHPRASPAELLDAAVSRGWLTPRRARAVRIAGVPALVLGTLAWLVASVLRTGGAPEPSPFAEFVDPAANSYLDVQLNSSATSFGAFSAVVPGDGRVWPTARVAASRSPSGGVELRYDGVGRRDRQTQPGDRSQPARPHSPPDVVGLRLVGQVDATRHLASVDVWVDGDRHHIGSAGQLSGAQDVVHHFLGAVLARDWDEVYSLETASMRNGSKRGDFVTAMPDAGAVTSVSAARPVGPTTYSRTPAGVWYARTPVRFTYAAGTATTDVDATVVLVVEGGGWSVLSIE
jgi:hypothetical protein